MRYLYMLVWVLLLIVGVVFASLNAHEVQLNLFVASVHVFLPLVILVAIVIGSVVGVLSMFPRIMKGKYANRKLRKHIHKVEKELRRLRSSVDESKKIEEY